MRRRHHLPRVLFLSAISAASCDDAPMMFSAQGHADAGGWTPPADAPVVDAAVDLPAPLPLDAGAAVDAGPVDAGPVDAGLGLALHAGAAAIELVPYAGSPLAGFGAAPRRVIDAVTIPLHLVALGGPCVDPDPTNAATLFARNTGTRDPIMAKAVVLSNGATKFALVKLDAIGVTRELHDDLLPLAASLGIPAENLIVAATHTHSGPGALSKKKLWQLVAADCFSQRAYDVALATAKRVLTDAHGALQPAALGFAAVRELGASQNRSGRPGIFDPELGVIKIVHATSGAPIAAVLNFAVHGTVLGASNMQFSGDVMGVTERVIERDVDGGVVAIFTNGAEGDVSPVGGFAAGTLLARRYVEAWPSVATRREIEIAGAFEDVTLPAPRFNTGCFPIPGATTDICHLIPGFSFTIQLTPDWLASTAPFKAVRLDKTVLASIPGEPITEIGLELKKWALTKGFDRAFVVGLANEHLGYITTRTEYERGEYEAQGTLYGPTTGEVTVSAAERVMERVRPPTP
ncbi:MAG: neutral/alkaline non-lysosomal ceramidase N-terminal domain-containing protein [Deltaproteobacteria bacterium]|nr:neutral/alkaline non-lysosomal ceramidase N-terminal domain-containing protein [Deltaproteobacteria bacterium]